MYVDTEEGKNETKWENVTASLCSLTCLAWEMIWPSENLKTPKSWHRDWVQEAKCSSSREVCIHWETHETQHNRGNMSGEPNKDSVFFSFLFFTQLLTAWECFFCIIPQELFIYCFQLSRLVIWSWLWKPSFLCDAPRLTISDIMYLYVNDSSAFLDEFSGKNRRDSRCGRRFIHRKEKLFFSLSFALLFNLH